MDRHCSYWPSNNVVFDQECYVFLWIYIYSIKKRICAGFKINFDMS